MVGLLVHILEDFLTFSAHFGLLSGLLWTFSVFFGLWVDLFDFVGLLETVMIHNA